MLGLFRPAGSLLKRTLTLSAAFLAGSMKNLGEVFPDRLTHFRRFDFHFAFTRHDYPASGESILRDARQRHENSRSAFDRILGEP